MDPSGNGWTGVICGLLGGFVLALLVEPVRGWLKQGSVRVSERWTSYQYERNLKLLNKASEYREHPERATAFFAFAQAQIVSFLAVFIVLLAFMVLSLFTPTSTFSRIELFIAPGAAFGAAQVYRWRIRKFMYLLEDDGTALATLRAKVFNLAKKDMGL